MKNKIYNYLLTNINWLTKEALLFEMVMLYTIGTR